MRCRKWRRFFHGDFGFITLDFMAIIEGEVAVCVCFLLPVIF